MMNALFDSRSFGRLSKPALLVGLVSVSFVLLSACSNDPGTRDIPEADTGGQQADTGSPDTQMENPDTGVEEDTGGMMDDAGDTSEGMDGMDGGDDGGGDMPMAAPVEANHHCAASGVSSGGGFTVIQCTSPTEVAGPEMQGNGLRLQTGALRVIAQ